MSADARPLPNRAAASDDAGESVVLLSAFEETSAQSVHTRTASRAGEVTLGVRVAEVFQEHAPRMLTVDLRRVNAVEPSA